MFEDFVQPTKTKQTSRVVALVLVQRITGCKGSRWRLVRSVSWVRHWRLVDRVTRGGCYWRPGSLVHLRELLRSRWLDLARHSETMFCIKYLFKCLVSCLVMVVLIKTCTSIKNSKVVDLKKIETWEKEKKILQVKKNLIRFE